MPSLRLHALFVACLCLTGFAEIPAEQVLGIYERTNPEHRELSPLWGMAALRSGLLRNLRFFGEYGPEPRQGLPRHPGAGPRDHPQDAVAGVIQYLFPSPDGENFVPNERTKDPIGALARNREEGLRRILVLLEAVTYRKTQMAGAGSRAVLDLTQDVRRILEPSEDPRSRYNVILEDFSSMLARAVHLEVADGGIAYPPRIVELALLGYAWRVADRAEELDRAFSPHLLHGSSLSEAKEPGPMDPGAFREGILKRLQTVDPRIAPDEIALFLDTQGSTGPLPELLGYGMATYKGASFPDCGETCLRNFFNIAFMREGAFSPSTFQAFLRRLPAEDIDSLKAIQAYFARFPRIQDQTTQEARNAWSTLVSDRNRPSDPLPILYRDGTHNLQGVASGPENLLNLVAHLVPDPVLNQPWPEGKGLLLEESKGEGGTGAKGREAWRLAVRAKLDRLCWLISDEERHYTVEEDAQESKGDARFRKLVFSLDDRPAFTWEFLPGHYAMASRLKANEGAWSITRLLSKGDPLLAAWAETRQGEPRILAPWTFYTFDLRSSDGAQKAIREILHSGSVALMPKVGLLVERSLPVDAEAYDGLLSSLLIFPPLGMDPRWYPIPCILALPQERKDEIFNGLPGDAELGEWIRFWIDHGLDPGTPFDIEQQSLLQVAVLENSPGLVRHMLKAGANVNQTDIRGQTPLLEVVLELATGNEDTEEGAMAILDLLLQAGADPGIPDNLGTSPLSLAMEWGHAELCERFKNALRALPD
jgi:hypothetical protein